MDGERIDMRAFLRDNREGLPRETLQAARSLRPGQRMDLGGGAAPGFTLRRLPRWEPCDAYVGSMARGFIRWGLRHMENAAADRAEMVRAKRSGYLGRAQDCAAGVRYSLSLVGRALASSGRVLP